MAQRETQRVVVAATHSDPETRETQRAMVYLTTEGEQRETQRVIVYLTPAAAPECSMHLMD